MGPMGRDSGNGAARRRGLGLGLLVESKVLLNSIHQVSWWMFGEAWRGRGFCSGIQCKFSFCALPSGLDGLARYSIWSW